MTFDGFNTTYSVLCFVGYIAYSTTQWATKALPGTKDVSWVRFSPTSYVVCFSVRAGDIIYGGDGVLLSTTAVVRGEGKAANIPVTTSVIVN